MRVFDMYSFNAASKVKFKDTKNYIQKMLTELNLCYTKVGFEAQIDFDAATGDSEFLQKILDKYPKLNKYVSSKEQKAWNKKGGFSSFTENWPEGEVYVEEEDWEEVLDLFTKIPRPFNFEYSRLILDGIDWYGGGNLAPATQSKASFDSVIWPFWLPFANSRIMIHRHAGDGNKHNMVHVIVEATTEGEPRDTTDVLEKLIPYLGEDYFTQRKCMFTHEEYDRYKELTYKYNHYLKDLCDEMIVWPYTKVPEEPKIPNIADKKTLQKAFKKTPFKFTDRKGLEPGMNILKYRDDHHYEYTIKFDKLFWQNEFSFSLSIKGHNFKVKMLIARNFGVTEEGQSEGILAKIVEYCTFVCEEVSKELSEEFGDTPEWFWNL